MKSRLLGFVWIALLALGLAGAGPTVTSGRDVTAAQESQPAGPAVCPVRPDDIGTSPPAPTLRIQALCKRSYCDDIGIRCVNVGSGKCPHCDYECGPDPTCLGRDTLPSCPGG